MSTALWSVGSLGADERRIPASLKPALKVLPVAQPVPQVRDAAPSGEVSHQLLPPVDFLDSTSPGIHMLQRHGDATRDLPKDGNGFPDWMKALSEGKIEPRSGLKPGDRMEVLDLDVVMRNTKEMPNVRFPHRAHTLWLACSNCHPQPFQAKAGSNSITMTDIFRGQFCGMCHDRVAFITFFSCYRCHNATQPRGN